MAYGLFVAAGAAGLGWQIIWARMFIAGLGHEMPALTCVVAAFMAGIAIGAGALDRLIGRSRRPVGWFAGLLVVAGFWGILTVWLIPWMNWWTAGWLGAGSASWLEWLVAIAAPTVALLPATAAMGASFAAMERVVAALARPGRHVAGLYAANTFGAALGVILVTVWLLPGLGLAKSAVMLSMAAILGALLVLGLRPDVGPERSAIASTVRLGRGWSGRRVLVTLVFTGLFGIGYELLVVRVLSQMFENTIYTYAAVLTVFLSGTALGAAGYRKFLREPGFAAVLIGLCGLLSTACLAGICVLGQAEALMRWLRSAVPGTLAGRAVAEGALVGLVLLPATVVMGALWSHLVQASRRPEGGIGAAVGANAVGCGLAPIVFGVVLLPRIGARWTLILIALGYLALSPRPRRGQWTWLVVPLGLLFWMPSSLRILEMPPGGELLAWRESLLGTVAVVREPDQTRTLRVDNRFQMGGTGSAAMAARHAHLAMLQHSAPRRALVLGVGTGLTFGAATLYPGLTADGVELVPEIVELMPLFEPENRQASRHPRLRMHTTDARRFVVGTRDRYDVVIGDLFHPARDGAALLYTREHFAAIRGTLRPGGIFCQWLPVHQMGEESLRMIVRTFLDVFPESHAWLLRFNVEVPVIGLVGGLHPFRFDPGWIEKRSPAEPLHAELRALGLADSLRFFGHWLAGPRELRSWSGDGVLNTDDHPRVLFLAPGEQGASPEEIHRRLELWVGLGSGADVLPGGLGEPAVFANSVRAYLGARDEYLAGLIHESEGRRERAIDAFLASARRSREFTAGYARCLTLAGLLAPEQPAVARALLERLDEAQPAIPVARQMLERLDSR
jgi:spermidine synthase